MTFISNIVLSNFTGLNDLGSLALTLAGSLALIEAASFFDFSSKKIQRIAGIASNQIYYFIYNCKPIFYLNLTGYYLLLTATESWALTSKHLQSCSRCI